MFSIISCFNLNNATVWAIANRFQSILLHFPLRISVNKCLSTPETIVNSFIFPMCSDLQILIGNTYIGWFNGHWRIKPLKFYVHVNHWTLMAPLQNELFYESFEFILIVTNVSLVLKNGCGNISRLLNKNDLFIFLRLVLLYFLFYFLMVMFNDHYYLLLLLDILMHINIDHIFLAAHVQLYKF